MAHVGYTGYISMDFSSSDTCASTAPPLPPLYLLLLRPPSVFFPGGRSLTTARQRSTSPVPVRARGWASLSPPSGAAPAIWPAGRSQAQNAV